MEFPDQLREHIRGDGRNRADRELPCDRIFEFIDASAGIADALFANGTMLMANNAAAAKVDSRFFMAFSPLPCNVMILKNAARSR